MDLPPYWKFALDEKGRIYYYHVKLRKSQWEPPKKTMSMIDKSVSTEIKKESEDESSKTDSDSCTVSEGETSTDKSERNSTKDSDCDVDTDTVTESSIQKERFRARKRRYNMLVQERPISPRREEDRIFNQINMRRYRRNKEKIRRRREELKRRKMLSQYNPLELEPSTVENGNHKEKIPGIALPIQDYLISSDEDDSSLITKFASGDKIVDELDALTKERPLRRSIPLKPKNGLCKDPRIIAEMQKESTSSLTSSEQIGSEQKSTNSPSGSKTLLMGNSFSEDEEKFRYDIGNVIIEVLTPHRLDTCQVGRISCDEDFIYLAKKLINLIFQKELKYCRAVGQTIRVSESVKKKSKEFIRNYMKKYGEVYHRPQKDK